MREIRSRFLGSCLLLLCGALAGCSHEPLGGVDGAGLADGGTGALACTAGQLPPACCDGAGQRVGTASCGSAQKWSCAQGALCTCGGVAATFVCSDFCGSDAYVDPLCDGSAWRCPQGTPVRSDTCPAGTCWGEPGDCRCCANNGAGPRVPAVCDNGTWGCPQGATMCASCN